MFKQNRNRHQLCGVLIMNNFYSSLLQIRHSKIISGVCKGQCCEGFKGSNLNTPAGSVSSGHTTQLRKKMTMTAMMVGLRKRATAACSSSLSTADASIAPAFLTCMRQHGYLTSAPFLFPGVSK